MESYATYDADGNLTGFYCQGLHPDHAGAHIVVDNALASSWPAYRMNAARDGVEAVPAAAPAIDVTALKQQLAAAVDSTIAGIYSKWFRFEGEYVARESAARVFVERGYGGEPGIWITGFSEPAGLTVNQAADLIIAQADGLRAALEALGSLRMAKYGILAAASAETAQATFDSIVSQVAAIAATL